MSSGMRMPGRRVPEPLPEVPLQGDLDLHEAEERPRHAVLPQDAEQRHRDHVAREHVLARRDQRGELVEALEEHSALHRREPHARDLEKDRLEQTQRRAALAAPVDGVAEVLPGHLDQGGHEAEEGGLDLARGLRREGRHQGLEEDDEALDRLRRVAARAAADGLDEAVAALGEDCRGQVEEAPLRDRRLARGGPERERRRASRGSRAPQPRPARPRRRPRRSRRRAPRAPRGRPSRTCRFQTGPGSRPPAAQCMRGARHGQRRWRPGPESAYTPRGHR